MAKASKNPGAKTKKTLKKEVAGTLTEIFADIKGVVGDKKFNKKVKKASKILSAGALKKEDKKSTSKKDAPRKDTEEKKAKKKEEKKEKKKAKKKEKKAAKAKLNKQAASQPKAVKPAPAFTPEQLPNT